MADRAQRADVLIVGAGVIGMSIAWRAALRGMSVTVMERGVAGGGTSRVAAGMLAPVAEAEFGAAARRLLELNLRSARLWPAFATELEDGAEASVGLVRSGTLLVAGDADEAADLERQRELRESLGLVVHRLRPSEAREREPALAPTLRLALEAPEDHSVDPRLVLAALRAACTRAGVDLREHAGVAALALDDGRGRVSAVTLADGDRLECERVVLAAGPWTGSIGGVPEGATVPVRPVKGQIMRLRDPAGPGLLTRVLRFSGGYVVPRADGRYVLGATVEERGFELAPTAGGVYELLRDAHEIVPGISEWQIEELEAGLRPGTPDNAPALGPGAVEGLWWATGHYRNGILLAPLSAELLVSSLAGEPGSWLDRATMDELLRVCDPARFGAPAGARSLEAVR